MESAENPGSTAPAEAAGGERYLLLADISGYTSFMTGVEHEHGADFSNGIPAAYGVLADLLNSVIEGIQRDFALVKLEGDAVFAAAPAAGLDGKGDRVLDDLATMYRLFAASRQRAIPSSDHVCTACPAVAHLEIKAVLHRGHSVRQAVGSGSDLLGPSVTVAHRLLKNSVRARTGIHPYLFMTDAAAVALGLSEAGVAHDEEYPDAGRIQGRVLGLA